MSAHGIFQVPEPHNEPVLGYEPGSPERDELRRRLDDLSSQRLEIPLVIGGEDVQTGDTFEAVMPHKRNHVLADVTKGGAAEVDRAIAAAADAWEDWSRTPWEDRAAVFLRAAELLAGPWRQTLNAATMLGQSKTAHQAEIDAACELIDFWRFNVQYMTRIYEEQPISSPGIWNRLEYRPLEGFVFAVTPFNFTSIAGNLPTSVALMGNTVVWKPASTAAVSAHFLMKLFEEAGLPPGVINLVSGSGAADRRPGARERDSRASTSPARPPSSRGCGRRSARTSPATATTRASSARPAARTSSSRTRAPTRRRSRPRSSAAPSSTRARSARPRRASSRPRASGRRCGSRLAAEIDAMKMGDLADFPNFVGAVIDAGAFATQKEAIEEAKASRSATIVAGGGVRRQRGLVRAADRDRDDRPGFRTDAGGVFGPVVTAFVYDDPATTTRSTSSTAAHATASPARSSRATARDRPRDATGCATRRATSTSTTSRPAPSSASSRSAARARRARTTRRARC